MNWPSEQILRLRRLASRSETEGDMQWLAEALMRYLLAADDGLTLEDAFEIRSPGNRKPWWRTDVLWQRDMWLRSLATFYPESSMFATADAVCEALERYAASRWPSERSLLGPPRRSWNTPEQCMWYILDANGGELISLRHLRRLLAK
jgi:hypothetical protein